ncbi:MAG: ATP-binding protein [Pseudonocardiales bacterium]|nr:ATP-binding protein [Pseudonocardiales bacterium]
MTGTDTSTPAAECQVAWAASRNGRPVVYLLVGLTGSGKTTYAAQLVAREGVVHLSVDEALAARHGRYGIDYPEPEHKVREAPIVAELTARMVELVRAGRSVVFDHGLWLRSERDAYKRMITEAGGCWRLLYFKAGREVLLTRLAQRNARAATDGTALMITPEALEDFYGRFEEPDGEGEQILLQR